MEFFDDEPLKCDVCGHLIQAGEEYILHKDGTVACCDECMKEYLFENCEDEYTTEYIKTAHDKECIKADMEDLR